MWFDDGLCWVCFGLFGAPGRGGGFWFGLLSLGSLYWTMSGLTNITKSPPGEGEREGSRGREEKEN